MEKDFPNLREELAQFGSIFLISQPKLVLRSNFPNLLDELS